MNQGVYTGTLSSYKKESVDLHHLSQRHIHSHTLLWCKNSIRKSNNSQITSYLLKNQQMKKLSNLITTLLMLSITAPLQAQMKNWFIAPNKVDVQINNVVVTPLQVARPQPFRWPTGFTTVATTLFFI
jgi:hypothetical protein